MKPPTFSLHLHQPPPSTSVCIPPTTQPQVDARIAERVRGELKFLDGESYRGLFCLSKEHRKTLANENRVLSQAKGTFATMHSQGLCIAEKEGE